jgi:hypothetical protein
LIQDLFETSDVAFGFLQVSLQSIFKLGLSGGLDHFRKSFGDLGFCGMELLELIDVEFSKAVEICGKEFHDLTSQELVGFSG